MMRFKIRRTLSGYTNVEVEVGGGKFDLGMFDKADCLELVRTLEEAVDALTEDDD